MNTLAVGVLVLNLKLGQLASGPRFVDAKFAEADVVPVEISEDTRTSIIILKPGTKAQTKGGAARDIVWIHGLSSGVSPP